MKEALHGLPVCVDSVCVVRGTGDADEELLAGLSLL